MRVIGGVRDFVMEFWRGAKAGYSRGYAESQANAGYLAAPPVAPDSYYGMETPGYRVLRHLGDAQIRSYGLRLYVQRILPDMSEESIKQGRAQLAAYLAGGNRKGTVYVGTTPLLLSEQGGQIFLRMGLPNMCNTQKLPDATDMDIRFATAHAGQMLVMDLPEKAPHALRLEKAAALRALAIEDGLDPLPDPLFLFYGADVTGPWMPSKAEVAILL